MARSEATIKRGAAPFLEEGEEVLAAFVARPRGSMAAEGSGYAGSDAAELVAGSLGRRRVEKNVTAAADAGFRLVSPMAVAVTQRRLLSIAVSNPIGWGVGLKVKELVSAVPVDVVDDIRVRRLALGKTVTITVRGTPFTLEVGTGANVSGVVEALNRPTSA